MDPADPIETKEEDASPQELRRSRFLTELLGIFMGLALAMMISALVPRIR